MNAFKKIAFSTLAIATIAQQSAFAAINSGEDKVNQNLRGRNDDLPSAIQSFITFALGFLALIAVILALYA